MRLEFIDIGELTTDFGFNALACAFEKSSNGLLAD